MSHPTANMVSAVYETRVVKRAGDGLLMYALAATCTAETSAKGAKDGTRLYPTTFLKTRSKAERESEGEATAQACGGGRLRVEVDAAD